MPKKLITLFITLLTALFGVSAFAAETEPKEVTAEKRGLAKFGVIKGVVRDNRGKPISKATVAVFRVGTSKLLKQVTATRKGRFFAKLVPGTYTILAIAQGFNPVTLKKVRVKRAANLSYGFK